MFKNLRKYLYMIWLGKKFIPIFRHVYLDTQLDEHDRYHALSKERQNYSLSVLEYLNVVPVMHGGLPEANRVLYIANHRSLLDIISIESLFSTQQKAGMWIAKQTLLDNKIYGKFFEYSGCIAVDLKAGKGMLAFFKKIKHIFQVAPDLNLFMFPEGERFGGEGVGPFQPGAEKIAKANKMQIVPIYIDDQLEKVYQASPFKQPYEVHIHIGEPLALENIEEQYRAFMDAAKTLTPKTA
ncbi:1-acyl-sn-glycerol-3-phosphate acyltransferase [Sulfurimonas sp. HSL-3221]|uniref:lysophospholipid acyltransferase family protein n=1 Tax=Sulfurimonadaceae TaxID=2771471 RepID=UPI001E31D820|nr:lysophospholipid acyltransferase family protein [Sulfurimonas sp. HSL-3221]UFS62393.1 1-acyl-sn-glycerol-3-phosphate acyltransferase [Sulfurimonas sp. HSL-3221]